MSPKNDKQNYSKNFNQKKIFGFSIHDLSIKISYFLILLIFIPLLFPSGRSLKYTDLTEGSIVNKKVIAPFTFPVLKTDVQLKEERNIAAGKVPSYFNYNNKIADEQIDSYEKLWNYLAELPKDFELKDSVNTLTGHVLSFETDSIINQIYINFKPGLSKEEIFLITKFIRDSGSTSLLENTIAVLRDIYDFKIINILKTDIVNEKIIMIESGVESDISFEKVYQLFNVKKIFVEKINSISENDLYKKLTLSHLKPNLELNTSRTELRKAEAVGEVPLAVDLVYENERIIDANERVTEEIYQKLMSLEIALAEKSALEGNIQNFLSYIGKYLLTFLILFLLYIYVFKNRPQIFKDNKKLFLVNLIIFLQVGIGALIVGPLGWSAYLIPTTISGMLLGILFDLSMGFIGTAVVGMLMGGILGLDYSIATMTVIAGIVAIYSVSKIRTRNQIFKAIFFIMLAYSAALFAFNTLRYEEISETFRIFTYFIIPNAILSPFITYMSLGVFERFFDITTDVTLLELSDMNHPLLKQLANKAPGTFHHSIVVGNLAESAAKNIPGSNSLLARVGSYYHDIGKMSKSEYFIENQKGGENKHDSLAPNMSALILAAHVKNGLELADDYKLPKRIRHFIPEHHGTNVMTYFYDRAKKSSDTSDINIEDYRYPGPKPQTKETAIVMLADTVEAAAKTLKNHTPGRLRKLVTDLVEKRFLDGELEDCNLMMRDLKGIVEGFVSVLIGIYHERIVYPSEIKTKNNEQKKRQIKQNSNKNGN